MKATEHDVISGGINLHYIDWQGSGIQIIVCMGLRQIAGISITLVKYFHRVTG